MITFPEMVALALKFTELEAGTKVPLLVQLPNTLNVLAPFIVKEAPEAMVMDLQIAPAAPTIGNLPPTGKVGICTSVFAVGMPPHQLLAVFQSVLVIPSHSPVVFTETVNETQLLTLQLPSARTK